MAEQADATVSKTVGLTSMRVRFPLGAPFAGGMHLTQNLRNRMAGLRD